LRIAIRALLMLPVLVWGCAAPPPPMDAATAKRQYLAAKNACVARYPDSLTAQSDCRTRAADYYIRPTYKYGDLMTRAQEQRRELAVEADRHEITRRAYDRGVARSEAAISREEDRRNANGEPGNNGWPFEPLVDGIANLFR
jgi:hypothetical protein